MNEQNIQDEIQPVSATLQMPQQNPPIDRTAAVPASTDTDAAGIEAASLIDILKSFL